MLVQGIFVVVFDLNNYSLLVIFLAGIALICVSIEVGHWLGRYSDGRSGGSVSTLQAAVFGLLALMIGFTFAMTLSRYDSRRAAVLSEANAIGTTALRARLLPEPHRTTALNLLRDYVNVRLDIAQRVLSWDELTAAANRSSAIQEALWREVRALAAKDNGLVPTGLFIQSLNDMIDQQEMRLSAVRNRVPNVVPLMLFGITLIGIGFAGYANSLETKRTRVLVYLVGVMVAAVIVLILDLDRPSAGFIEVSQQPMVDTANAIAGYQKSNRKSLH